MRNSPDSIAAQEEVKENPKKRVRHPLMRDGWLDENEPDLARVYSVTIANVTRAADGIRTLSRLLHNSRGEPFASGAQPLGESVEMDLLDVLFCLGDYVFEQTESMRESADMLEKLERESEAKHG